MKEIQYKQLQEKLYYEKMANGLQVYILPKPEFNKTYATFTTKYGSIDNHFMSIKNEEMKVPDGIAHFLEHKLFEKEDGDVFQLFSKQGAAANAFTSFTRTAYLFSCTSDVEKNLETLINFVQEPYFTEETVEKEKGIIGQEIKMYDDNPDWRLYFGAIESLYKNHPVHIDIAGTVESIADITKDLLYDCYETFYHPSNMLLFIVGPVNPEVIMTLVRNNQDMKDYREKPEVERFFDNEPTDRNEKKKIIKMSVQTPKCLVGIKADNPSRQGNELLKNELAISLLLDYLFGKGSDKYQELYEQGYIDDSFSFDYSEEYGFGFGMIGGDTKFPEELAKEIQQVLLSVQENRISADVLERVKKKKIGSFLRALNSPEFIANQFTRYAFNEMSLFEVVPTLEGITAEDIMNIAESFLKEERISVCQVLPNDL